MKHETTYGTLHTHVQSFNTPILAPDNPKLWKQTLKGIAFFKRTGKFPASWVKEGLRPRSRKP